MNLSQTEAEEATVGACLLSNAACEVALRQLTPSDFYSPSLRRAFTAIAMLWERGEKINVVTVSALIQHDGGTIVAADLIRLQIDTIPAHIDSYVGIVAKSSALRRLAAIGSQLASEAQAPYADPMQLADSTATELQGINSPALLRDPGDVVIDDWITHTDEAHDPIVPGLLNVDDRVIVVAGEGVGKSTLLRQIAVMVSFGIHPFRPREVVSQPILVIDLENPAPYLRTSLHYLVQCGINEKTEQSEARTLLHKPAGIDLRKRLDRALVEDVLRRRRPRLVVLGPLYKSYSRKASESDEQVASEVQVVLDDWRTRYAFGLLLEHHAPQWDGASRTMRPQGSALWLRWPEFGLKLVPKSLEDASQVHVGRWRLDRAKADWPNDLVRGTPWPWVPVR